MVCIRFRSGFNKVLGLVRPPDPLWLAPHGAKIHIFCLCMAKGSVRCLGVFPPPREPGWGLPPPEANMSFRGRQLVQLGGQFCVPHLLAQDVVLMRPGGEILGVLRPPRAPGTQRPAGRSAGISPAGARNLSACRLPGPTGSWQIGRAHV